MNVCAMDRYSAPFFYRVNLSTKLRQFEEPSHEEDKGELQTAEEHLRRSLSNLSVAKTGRMDPCTIRSLPSPKVF